MHLCPRIRCLVVVTIICTTPLAAAAGTNTWTSNGPSGQWIRALAVDPATPTTLYAGSEVGGVFGSTDGGDSWTALNTGLTDVSVLALALDPTAPSTLYAGTASGGVFRSVDGGALWAPANTGLTNLSILALAIDPVDPLTVYAGTNGGGVFKSTDGGATWVASNTGSSATGILALAIDPTNPDVVYSGGQSMGVHKSLDGGATWTPVAVVPEKVFAIAVDASQPETVYAGSAITGMFKTTNGGTSWTQINLGIDSIPRTIRSVVIDPTVPTTLYTGTAYGGVYVSLNGGLSWAGLNDGLTNLNVSAVALDPTDPQQLYAGTIGPGVFAYTEDACDDGGVPVTCGQCEICNPAFGCIGDVWLGCRVPTQLRKAKLTVKDKDPDNRDRIVWTWSRGEETVFGAFGDPLSTTTYDVCIFDESAGTPALALHSSVEPAVLCNSKPCWKNVSDHRFRYRNGEAFPDGVTKLLLNSGEESKAKVVLKAKGELLTMPTLPMGLPFRLQLRNDLGECWQALYTEAGMRRNDETQFVGKSGL